MSSSQLRGRTESDLRLAVITLGFISIVTQVILLREFLSVFYGNELVIGIIFASWMILTAAGSYTGRLVIKSKRLLLLVDFSLVLVAVLPYATVFILRYLRNIVFDAGSMVGVFQVLYSSLVLMMPYCLVAGMSFTVFAHIISEQRKSNLVTHVYAWETLGSVIGGLIFNLAFVYFLTTFQSLLVILLFGLSVAFVLSTKNDFSVLKYVVLIIACFFLITATILNVDVITKQFLFRDQEVVDYRDTPYGNLTITQQGDQKNFYENGALLFSTNDRTLNEESVHYAMIQHPNPKHVLLVSGGISGTIEEILKYNVDKVDYVEINPWIIAVGKKYASSLNDRRVRVINQDARLYVKDCGEKYDVVLLNVPDPTTAQLNRYYTIEFLRELKKILNDGAVVQISLLENVDYYGPAARMITSIMHNTLGSLFKNILIVPGTTKNYFLASDGELSMSISRMVGEKGIRTVYVNRYYVDDQLQRQRSDEFASTIQRGTTTNQDFFPISYYQQLRFWLSYFDTNQWILAAVAAIVLVVLISRLNTISFGVFACGFTASSIELLLLIAFQIIYGYVFQIVGIIITVFMVGLAVGSRYRKKIFSKDGMNTFIALQVLIALFCVLLPALLVFMKNGNLSSFLVHAFFLLLTFTIAALVGMGFSVGSILQRGSAGSIAAGLYGADLAGSAVGALLTTAYLIPSLGIVSVSFIVAAVSFTGAVVSLFNQRKYSSLMF